jgi:hypothetical protein
VEYGLDQFTMVDSHFKQSYRATAIL